MTLFWLVSLWLKNSGIVDIFWGTCFIIANWVYPILMTLILLHVLSVELLEKTLETRPGYKKYFENTSAFIPWLPRKK
jgi:steroid 5-alpha reductase family enzyme